MSSPEVAKENKHQIRETKHWLKAILEQKNGLSRRIFSMDSVDNTRLYEATDKFIQRNSRSRLPILEAEQVEACELLNYVYADHFEYVTVKDTETILMSHSMCRMMPMAIVTRDGVAGLYMGFEPNAFNTSPNSRGVAYYKFIVVVCAMAEINRGRGGCRKHFGPIV
ncbi:casein lytic proteinase B3 [Artemisia annua]|uniref:Casein lytic proteinase B3 n=1 Tax=Artemisia annua TaxID=35608 RepID=A0A2U1QF38_ARTAN|nr:casein lytic proteinase B3 [Artemisia annua]